MVHSAPQTPYRYAWGLTRETPSGTEVEFIAIPSLLVTPTGTTNHIEARLSHMNHIGFSQKLLTGHYLLTLLFYLAGYFARVFG